MIFGFRLFPLLPSFIHSSHGLNWSWTIEGFNLLVFNATSFKWRFSGGGEQKWKNYSDHAFWVCCLLWWPLIRLQNMGQCNIRHPIRLSMPLFVLIFPSYWPWILKKNSIIFLGQHSLLLKTEIVLFQNWFRNHLSSLFPFALGLEMHC